MTDPITASAIATLAFQKFIKSSAGELAKKFTGEAIIKMEQLRELIWSRLTGKHPAADVALEQAKAGEQVGIDTVAALLSVEMLDEAFAGQVKAIAHEINAGKILDQSSMFQNTAEGGKGGQYVISAGPGTAKPTDGNQTPGIGLGTDSELLEVNDAIGNKHSSTGNINYSSTGNINFGKAIIDAPHQMKVGVSEQVKVRISKFVTNAFFSGLAHSKEFEIENIRVSRFMAVSLRGDNFKIESFSTEQQIIEDHDFTQWEWKILPLKSGNRKLWVSISIQIKYENEQTSKTLPVLEKEIQVSINPVYSSNAFVKQYWQWLIASAIIPIVALLVKK
jgi:hypothetical protein